ncbi:MAG: gliding motility-associated C-terminal domain-containing protein [Bacteroidia bacterium]|nr:gliding motility-associated C-terminal domain-containing protein [Bacteroidia bacterium]
MMPKYFFTIALAAALAVNSLAGNKPKPELTVPDYPLTNNALSFTENKGQVYDQNNQSRPDVLFGGQSNGLVFHLRKNGISYQLNRIDKWKTEKLNSGANKKENKPKGIEQSTVYRVDINWLNTGHNPSILRGRELEGFSTFYTSNNPVTVKSFGEITYQHLYKGIDLKWYEKNGELKYDYLCAPGSDYKKIKLQIEGALHLSINPKGELEIATPLGTISEKAPVVLQGGKTLKSNWVLTENVLSFNIENLNQQLDYIIDPAVRVWGTYYGGNSFDYANACATYTNGDVYMVGSTYLNTSTIIATSGGFQNTLGGSDDAFLVKFNSSGTRLWSTYYGGSASDNGRSVVVDGAGNVYICGITSSSNNISTSGAYQQTFGGSGMADAFLVKFNSSGARQWGTYYGGNTVDEAHQCALDPTGNIYMSGTTEYTTGTVIATSGAQQSAYGGGFKDAFLVKFDASGVRQWGTYYGGSDIDFGTSCVANSTHVYMAGTTASTNNISSGGYQNSYGGNLYDAYLVKFNVSNGTRVWGTFYGGGALDQAFGCALDALGNVYLCGSTSSSVTNVIASAASHQSVGATAGDDDAFLVKFSSSGGRLWGTYYGGDTYDVAYGCTTNANNDVYLAGTTTSTLNSAIATSASQQTVLGNSFGGTNAFLAKFNAGGTRQWGTFYGEDGDDGNSCALDPTGAIYLCGPVSTTNTSFISTGGSHQVSHGGILDGFLAKFVDCAAAPSPTNTTSSPNQIICSGQSSTLSASSGTNTINWYATSTSTSVLGTGSNFTTPTLSTGTYTYYAAATSSCGTSLRTSITFTVNSGPTISVNSGSICAGQIFTITPSGATSYTINGNAVNTATVSPGTNSNYTVTGATGSCLSVNTVTSVVTIAASPTISVNSGSICAGQNFVMVPGGANTYTIQGGTATVSPVASANYTVMGTGANGCLSQSSATASLTVNQNPTITVTSGSVCAFSVFTITPGGASTYTIQGGNFTVSPTSNSTYTVTGTSTAGCISQSFATASVSVLALPVITANSGSVCPGQSFTIQPSGATTYTVFDALLNPQLGTVITPTITSSYLVFGTNSNGCNSNFFTSSSVTITVNSTPTITANGGTICAGQSFTVLPSGANTYTVFNSAGTPVGLILSPPLTPSIYPYYVMGTSTNGCSSGFSSAQLSVNVNPSPTLVVNSGTICAGQSYVIQPTGVNSYTIQGGTATVSPVSTSNYTVTGTGANGCVSANASTCTVTVEATPTISVNSGSVCMGSSYTIQASGANTYTYQGGSNIVTPNSNSTYTVIGKSLAGCLSQNAATCNITALSTPTITAANGTVCPGQSFTIVPAGAVSYSLVNATTGLSYTSNMVVTPLTTTNYVVSGTGSNGCVSRVLHRAAVTVSVNPANIAVNSGTICSGKSFTLNATGAVTYTYPGGSAIVSPSTTSNYTVTGTDATGCRATGIATVFVEPIPAISVNSGSVCPGRSFTIVPGGGIANSYTILGGGNSVVTPTANTTYTVIGKTAGLCANTATTIGSVNLYNVSNPMGKLLYDYEFFQEYGKITKGVEIYLPNSFIGVSLFEFDYKIQPAEPLYIHNDHSYGNSILNGRPTDSRTYTITATQNNSGCAFEKTIKVTYKDLFEASTPNYFSPDGDGDNDFWVFAIGLSRAFSIKIDADFLFISNSNGIVFNSKNASWDGNDAKGNPLPAGVYTYWLKLTDNPKNYVGTITLSRTK